MQEHKDEYALAKKDAELDVTGEKSAAWKKTMATAFSVLQRRRDARARREHEVVRKANVAAYADIRATLDTVGQSTCTLPERAGFAVFSLGCRTDYGISTEPVAIVPPVLEDFFETKLGMSAIRLAQQAESFVLGGGSAGAATKERNVHDLKKGVADRLRISFGKIFFLLLSTAVLTVLHRESNSRSL